MRCMNIKTLVYKKPDTKVLGFYRYGCIGNLEVFYEKLQKSFSRGDTHIFFTLMDL